MLEFLNHTVFLAKALDSNVDCLATCLNQSLRGLNLYFLACSQVRHSDALALLARDPLSEIFAIVTDSGVSHEVACLRLVADPTVLGPAFVKFVLAESLRVSLRIRFLHFFFFND